MQQTNLEELLKEARQKVVLETSKSKGGAIIDPNRLPDLGAKVRFNLPRTLRAEKTSDMVIERETLQNELDQGFAQVQPLISSNSNFIIFNMEII